MFGNIYNKPKHALRVLPVIAAVAKARASTDFGSLLPQIPTAGGLLSSVPHRRRSNFSNKFLFLQCLIHTSHAVSLKIHGHVCKAIFFECFYDLPAILQDFLEFIWQNFDPRQSAVDTDTQLMETKVQKKLLCFVYHAKFFLGNGLAVHETGGKTGKRLFFPGWKSKVFGQGTDVLFI